MVIKTKNYDDSKVREFGIKFTKDAFNLLFESHPNCKAIDLIDPNDYSFGVELERGGWLGNFWENDYSFVSGMAIRTINVPIRKLKYWYTTVYNKRVPNNDKNIFIRTNKDFTQTILIRPETIKDETKILFTEFKPKNSDEIEKWMSFEEKNVETYNLIDDIWQLQKIKIKDDL
jgi:hypothetical protein